MLVVGVTVSGTSKYQVAIIDRVRFWRNVLRCFSDPSISGGKDRCRLDPEFSGGRIFVGA